MENNYSFRFWVFVALPWVIFSLWDWMKAEATSSWVGGMYSAFFGLSILLILALLAIGQRTTGSLRYRNTLSFLWICGVTFVVFEFVCGLGLLHTLGRSVFMRQEISGKQRAIRSIRRDLQSKGYDYFARTNKRYGYFQKRMYFLVNPRNPNVIGWSYDFSVMSHNVSYLFFDPKDSIRNSVTDMAGRGHVLTLIYEMDVVECERVMREYKYCILSPEGGGWSRTRATNTLYLGGEN